MTWLRSYLFFVVDMACAAWDAALHVWDDDDDHPDPASATGASINLKNLEH